MAMEACFTNPAITIAANLAAKMGNGTTGDISLRPMSIVPPDL